MEALMNLMHGFGVLADPMNIVYMFVGITLGVLIGVLPGLGGANGVAILLPLTFSMSPTSAIIMLAGVYYGSMYGGTITSVLLRIPGEAASAVTAIDGYEMTKAGRAGPALAISAVNRRARSSRALPCMRAGISSERSSRRKSVMAWGRKKRKKK